MIEERAQRAAEQLLEDESLTDEMNDAEATSLIEWGVAISRRLCEQTAKMADDEAEVYLYPALKSLRRTIRQINDLFGSLPDEPPDVVLEILEQILETASEIPGLVVQPPEDMGFASRLVRMQTPGDALATILAYLAPENTEHGTQEE